MLLLVRGYKREKEGAGRFEGSWVILAGVSKVVRLTSHGDGLGGAEGRVKGDLSVCGLLSQWIGALPPTTGLLLGKRRLNADGVWLLENLDSGRRSHGQH